MFARPFPWSWFPHGRSFSASLFCGYPSFCSSVMLTSSLAGNSPPQFFHWVFFSFRFPSNDHSPFPGTPCGFRSPPKWELAVIFLDRFCTPRLRCASGFPLFGLSRCGFGFFSFMKLPAKGACQLTSLVGWVRCMDPVFFFHVPVFLFLMLEFEGFTTDAWHVFLRGRAWFCSVFGLRGDSGWWRW